jgi:hypothetical protein
MARTRVQHTVPEENLEIYELLFRIETVLRELIIDALSTLDGPRWFQRRLPSECRDQFKLGLERDRATKWTTNVPHHPVYYINFPDLRLTIEQRENWASTFKDIFPKNKELVTTDLLELEFIRNKVAHNRRATSSDVDIVKAAHSKLSNALGPRRFELLVGRYTNEPNIPRHIQALLREVDVSYSLCARGRLVLRLDQWKLACRTWWWFDEAYLGRSLGRVNTYFERLEDYQRIPRDSPTLASWARDQDIASRHIAARADLQSIHERWTL